MSNNYHSLFDRFIATQSPEGVTQVLFDLFEAKLREVSLSNAPGADCADLVDLADMGARNGHDEAADRRFPPLRSRELECIRWIAAGKTMQDVADLTGLSVRTVRYHLDTARERFGYATNMQLIVKVAQIYGLDPLFS